MSLFTSDVCEPLEEAFASERGALILCCNWLVLLSGVQGGVQVHLVELLALLAVILVIRETVPYN